MTCTFEGIRLFCDTFLLKFSCAHQLRLSFLGALLLQVWLISKFARNPLRRRLKVREGSLLFLTVGVNFICYFKACALDAPRLV